MKEFIEVPFGAKDSELVGWEYTIPEGMEATIVDNKIVVKKKENEDDKVRKELYDFCIKCSRGETIVNQREEFQRWADWLEKQGKTSIENVAKEMVKDKESAIKFLKSAGIINDNGELAKEYAVDGVEQNPTWSEWDEKIYNLLYEKYKDLAYYSHSRNKAEDIPGEILGWLKSIKERVQPKPKQEWSHEDYNEIETIACHLDNTDNEDMAEVLRNIRDKYYRVIPQNTWKPSESDILLLERIANGKSNPKDFQASLGGLIGRLKKLREG